MTILSVSQINQYIKSLIDYDTKLKNIYITGEISNYKPHYSGHEYFTLKDSKSEIRAVMFKQSAMRLRFSLENGMKVIVRGRITVYDAKGQYQIICDDLQPDGIGALTIAFEQLKNKLEKEGLFLQESKKSIPQFPEKIGVITAPTGAAVHDIMSILERRYPLAEIVFVPVAVQGSSAAPQIAKALDILNKRNDIDVIILGRGGGSIEDLWAFNEEIVARAIYKSNIPIISAVGHETDFTISDFVADLRAPTPSAAAELCVPDYEDLLFTIDNKVNFLKEQMYSIISDYMISVSDLKNSISVHNPHVVIEQNLNTIKTVSNQIKYKTDTIVTTKENELENLILKIDNNSPLRIMAKGYSIVRNDSNSIINSVSSVEPEDKITVTFPDGSINCIVK